MCSKERMRGERASTGNRLINGSQLAQKGPVGGPRSRELAIMAVKVTPARVGDKVGERVTEKGIQKSNQKKVAKTALKLGDKTRVGTRVKTGYGGGTVVMAVEKTVE